MKDRERIFEKRTGKWAEKRKGEIKNTHTHTHKKTTNSNNKTQKEWKKRSRGRIKTIENCIPTRRQYLDGSDDSNK